MTIDYLNKGRRPRVISARAVHSQMPALEFLPTSIRMRFCCVGVVNVFLFQGGGNLVIRLVAGRALETGWYLGDRCSTLVVDTGSLGVCMVEMSQNGPTYRSREHGGTEFGTGIVCKSVSVSATSAISSMVGGRGKDSKGKVPPSVGGAIGVPACVRVP